MTLRHATLHKIVVISPEPQVQQLARQIGREIFVADDPSEAPDIIKTINPDLVLFDHRLGPNHIRRLLDTTDKNSIDVPLVVVGIGENDTPSSQEFIQMGAAACLGTTDDHHPLMQIINQIKNKPEEDPSGKNLGDFFLNDCAAVVSMVGRSKAIAETLRMIKLIAASRCNPVLIVGETGTGKELAAKAVHNLRHPDGQFVAVNCAALTTNLLESELFGHVKGSFTGADREKTGLLELADIGTIFLDEISEMPMDLQAKLLRLLQEKTFRKVGGIKDIACGATIITSSNRSLKAEVRKNRFRRDLYYRLNICPITLAPLRAPERKDDIPRLAEYFLRSSTICPKKTNKITAITKLAVEALEQHDWPGNVRELRNIIERAILLETTDKIGLSSIVIDPVETDGPSDGSAVHPVKDFSLAKAEQELIARALKETNWQKTKAADLLGISRATLYTKVKQHNIEKTSSSREQPAKEVPLEVVSTS